MSNTDRVDRCINLGLTDQKCDQYEVVNILGGIKPSLIQTKTSTRDLPPEVLKGIADLALYCLRDVIPKTNFDKCYPNSKGPLHDLHTEFARQLCLTDCKDIEEYCIPGIALIIPTMLRPHKDMMNPKGDTDVTCQINVSIDLKHIPTELHDQLQKEHGDAQSIPISILFYPRKCNFQYEKRKKAISMYIKRGGKEIEGRTQIVDVFGDVTSHFNYRERFFTKSGYVSRALECKETTAKDFGFEGKIGTSLAAVDKMVSHFVSKFAIATIQ
jgi:hypothetical protein